MHVKRQLDKKSPSLIRRQPHPAIAGKGRLIGDLVQPVVDEGDWECLNSQASWTETVSGAGGAFRSSRAAVHSR